MRPRSASSLLLRHTTCCPIRRSEVCTIALASIPITWPMRQHVEQDQQAGLHHLPDSISRDLSGAVRRVAVAVSAVVSATFSQTSLAAAPQKRRNHQDLNHEKAPTEKWLWRVQSKKRSKDSQPTLQ